MELCLLKNVLFGIPGGQRGHGRPKLTFIENGRTLDHLTEIDGDFGRRT